MRQRGNAIERLNPLDKLAAVLCLGISVMVFPSLWFGVAILASLFIVSAVARLARPFATLMLSFGVPITIMLVFIQGGFSERNKTALAQIGPLTLGLEGTLYALRIILTVLVFLGSFYIMNKTTAPSKLVAALSSTGMPAKAGYLILSSLNVVPQMQRRMGIIQEAQAARGLSTGGRSDLPDEGLRATPRPGGHVLAVGRPRARNDIGDPGLRHQRNTKNLLRGGSVHRP